MPDNMHEFFFWEIKEKGKRKSKKLCQFRLEFGVRSDPLAILEEEK